MKRVAAIVALCASGCSLLFVHGPPDDYRRSTGFECSDASVWPVLDLLAVAYVVMPVVLAGALTSRNDSLRTGLFIGGGVALGLTTTSSVAGFRRLRACRNAKRDWAAAHRPRPARAASPWDQPASSPWAPPVQPPPPPSPKPPTPW